ncbi:MAG: hypothetical protein AAF518_20855 [Spirochaetota bacterium]
MQSFPELQNAKDYMVYRIRRNYKLGVVFFLLACATTVLSYFLVSLHGKIWFNIFLTLANVLVCFLLFFSILTVYVCSRDIIRYKNKLKKLTLKLEEDIRLSYILERQE